MMKLITGFYFFCCLFLLASCVSKKSAIDGAASYPAEVSVETQHKYNHYLIEAAQYKQKGEYDAALELYTHCVELNPQAAAAHYELAQFYFYLQMSEKGEQSLLRAVALQPENYWYNQSLALFYQNKGEIQRSIVVLENMLKQFPQRLEPITALVDAYSRSKEYEQVVNALNVLESRDGKSEQISMEKFRAYLALNDTDKAFSEIENLSKEYPYDMRYLTILGDLYLDNNRLDEAHAIYDKVRTTEPDYTPVLLSLVNYYGKAGLDEQYNKQVDDILQNERVEVSVKMNLMRQLILQSERTDKDSVKIASLFHSVLGKPQETADLAMLGAQYLISKNMEEESIPVLKQVLDIDPENTPARLQLLEYAIRKQDMDNVIAICLPALQYVPESIEFYYYLGLAYYQKDDSDNALKVFTKGTAHFTSQTDKGLISDFYGIISDLYHKKNMREESYAASDSALVYNPENISVLNNYAYYLSLERTNLDKAEEMSYKTVKAEPKNGTYLDTYAWILFEKGRYTEALIYAEQALQNGGDESSVVVEHCGDIYYMTGNKEKALECWIKAEELSHNPPKDGESAREEKDLKILKKKIAQKKYLVK